MNQTIKKDEPKFIINSARVGGVSYTSEDVVSKLSSGELTLAAGDCLFLDSGMSPEATLEQVQTVAADKYAQFCSEGHSVSPKIKICDTTDRDICVPFRRDAQKKMSL